MLAQVYGRHREKVTDYFFGRRFYPANASGSKKPGSNAQINAFFQKQ
jgi:hypothetical protein